MKKEGSMRDFCKELLEKIKDTVMLVLFLYGLALAAMLILMFFTARLWFTDDVTWLGALLFALITPAVILIVIFIWWKAMDIHCKHILKTLIVTQTENQLMQKTDEYLRDLLFWDKLREWRYDKVRETREACFENGRILEKKLLEYRQLLYDVDPEYAAKRKFYADPAEAAKAEKNRDDDASGTADASGKNATNTAGTTGTAAGTAAAGAVGSACVSSYDDLDDDDSIALDMEEAIDDDIMFHGGNPFDWDTRSDYLDDPFGFGDDDGFGGDVDEW